MCIRDRAIWRETCLWTPRLHPQRLSKYVAMFFYKQRWKQSKNFCTTAWYNENHMRILSVLDTQAFSLSLSPPLSFSHTHTIRVIYPGKPIILQPCSILTIIGPKSTKCHGHLIIQPLDMNLKKNIRRHRTSSNRKSIPFKTWIPCIIGDMPKRTANASLIWRQCKQTSKYHRKHIIRRIYMCKPINHEQKMSN